MAIIPYPSVDNCLIHEALGAGLRLSRPSDCIGPVLVHVYYTFVLVSVIFSVRAESNLAD